MKKLLEDILREVDVLKMIGFSSNKWIEGLSICSKMIKKKNMIFFAHKGTRTDGHRFIIEAIQNGANTIVCEKKPFLIQKSITYVLVQDSIIALGTISSNFYDNPTRKIKLVGITGTNGKTSVATMLHSLFYKMGEKTILISTIGIKILSKKFTTEHTTPNIIDINKYLNISMKQGCKYGFMEVSSHGIHQKRIEGLLFAGGVFTNITHDHLDYHQSFENYLSVKRFFFENYLQKNSFALINADDKNSHEIIKNVFAKTYFYGLKKKADFRIKILINNINGNRLIINGHSFFTGFIGEFNVYNLLASYATSILLGKNKHEILKTINTIKPIKGRCEQFFSNSGIRIIVDYAHNPDGIKTVLNTIKGIKKKEEKLICVIGCGGNRDKEKRSLMGKIVYETCDRSIFTSDNPREEDPEKILIDMKKFISNKKNKKDILTIVNRKLAIQTAIRIAKRKDIIVIAGKGHENYQEIQGKRYPFDDMKIAKKFLKNLRK
ncbi:MAG: UDP-N-acetylmuramoyl-L-alanyl-D-glutamate--2,6-diaminopimelate ligase [Flavobacteriales bacterium]|jgi:UDP-N-acetylmuramoyl-L-alanyl-D-glutamate--2,6-diaminopimelate ligase|uniref:UDP-N-acetylmuramoyl-L-alanyl-D-glutamate--2, 6-diaminopimelate ligase n=1 Tax=Blattabacterium sp. (Mastotermes darwiniensis) TaxID=39768 RepID=UPI000231DF9F|nr:UDP-N-acetylmuramoyl-L-alanyl-D-glutamate--2,6-diaminopimelate ligase [Blattabacterium sp. (Mastotermes darwiniensis)]AER40439.1 UDP-N-acetylmuramoylalanyl-D-glutamate--2, 6-diaminopimelate ligase [Blattabacterium sp. (Mastotermes darwiniensis) str. MADAR]MDR1804839.1 UDP-N-acetylmuramoyl-L-alanyl-D-glutamate--2,6-diaminopimelate ligase [Flavobacteriales bacterium]